MARKALIYIILISAFGAVGYGGADKKRTIRPIRKASDVVLMPASGWTSMSRLEMVLTLLPSQSVS